MSRTYLFAVLAWVLVVSATQAQPYSTPSPALPESSGPAFGQVPAPPPPAPPAPPVPDDWILYRKCETCCGPMGGNGPLRSELFLNNGVSFPIGGDYFGRNLLEGWDITGGGRLMLFDNSMTSAWLLELSGTNINNQARSGASPTPLSVLVRNNVGQLERINFGVNGVPGAVVRDLNRTFVNLAVGKDWWVSGPAGGCGYGSCEGNWNWRWGVDVGGRYGTGRATFINIHEESDVMEGVFAGIHADVEIPCGCCVFTGGLRAEWSYTWSDVLRRSDDIQEINFLFTVGVRY